jgi:FXSXX-COOH protein
MTQPWAPLVDVSEVSLVELAHSYVPGSAVQLATQRVIDSLGGGPDGVISAFQSVLDDPGVMVSGFGSAI